MKLLDRLERDDVLMVTKLDRLGRNTIDVATTVQRLATRGVRVHCLALGGVDLTSPAGPMRMSVIAAVAQFERDLLVERTQAGLDRARSEGKTLGRPAVLTDAQRRTIQERLATGTSVSEIARQLGTSRHTVMRARDISLTGRCGRRCPIGEGARPRGPRPHHQPVHLKARIAQIARLRR